MRPPSLKVLWRFVELSWSGFPPRTRPDIPSEEKPLGTKRTTRRDSTWMAACNVDSCWDTLQITSDGILRSATNPLSQYLRKGNLYLR